MMKKNFLTLCIALVMSVCAAYAQDISTRTIDTEHLRGIAAHCGFDLTLKQGPVSSAVITVDSRLLPYLHTTVHDDVLDIRLNDLPTKIQRQNLLHKAEVTVSSLEKLNAHSGAYVHGTGSFTTTECEVEVHSGAMVKDLNVTATLILVSVHSGANASLTGSVKMLEVTTASGGTAELTGLQVQEVEARASSGSFIECWVTNSLTGHASSGATIRYKGRPTHVDTESSSGGSVYPIR